MVVLFLEPFQQSDFLSHLKNLAHMLRSSLSTVLKVTNNSSTSTFDGRFNILWKSLGFIIIIKKLRYYSISLRSNIIYGPFIVEESYKYQRQNVSNIVLLFNLYVIPCNVFIINQSIHRTKLLIFLHLISLYVNAQNVDKPKYDIIFIRYNHSLAINLSSPPKDK